MNILGIIPARGGSKRVPGKNVKPLAGKPVLAWTIEAALRAGCLQRLIVSTDEPGIAELARSHGAEVPWLRSPALSTDTAGVVDAIIEVLDRLQDEGSPSPDAVMLLQPTSPFRSAKTIAAAARLFGTHCPDSVVSVSPARTHPHWCRVVGEDGTMKEFIASDSTVRSQDLPAIYALNGAIYIADTTVLRQGRSFYGLRTRALIMHDEAESLDIDTPYDWMVAEAIADRQQVAS